MPSKLLPISDAEKKWAKKLPERRGWQYHFSRGCARDAISKMTGFDPLEIPLKADPGKAPILSQGWGHISMSHCSDALLVGWSEEKIGIDIERKDRNFRANQISIRFFSKFENREIENLTPSQAREQILKRWVVKEAAIKFHHGKISTNIKQWIWENNSSFAYHEKLGYQVKVFREHYGKWTYAIVLDKNSLISKPIICIN